MKSVGTLNLIQSIQHTFSVLYVFPPMERVPLGQKRMTHTFHRSANLEAKGNLASKY